MWYAVAMTKPQNTDGSEREDRPGKTRTWWHPLLARLLDYELATGYAVRDEVLVGKLPLRVDILLIRREAGQLSEAGRRDLSVLVPLLNRFTLIEFKGPTDTLEPGDLAQLAGCAFLWHSQQAERVPQADVSLIVLAPSVNEGVRDELRCLGWEIREHEAGVHCITGGPFTMWLIETDVMAELGQPVFSLVSRVFLKEHERIIEQLTRTGHGMLLCYTLQQIEQFRSLGEEFVMQHADTEYMGELEEELQTAVLEAIPVERRLRGLPAEERLRGLPAEERLRGLSPEEVLRRFTPREVLGRLTPEELAGGLSDEQAERLRELLERRQRS
jgi:hypothetical protein